MSNISVCIATYNGENYIESQLISILTELNIKDEVIIVDDCSSDDTIKVIRSISDSRIKLFFNEKNIGHIKSFERAINLSTGSVIFLSDQDDVWISGRVVDMVQKMQDDNSNILFSSFNSIDENGRELNKKILLSDKKASSFNLILKIFLGRSNYWGCSMCLNRSFLDIALPIPKSVEAHDIWFALVGCYTNKITNYSQITLLHRFHAFNQTPKRRRSLIKVLISRVGYIVQLVIISARKGRGVNN
jgi:glycosyltransferase involved in cell wall biosynthesis